MLEVQVSEEYLDTICDWLDSWIEKPQSKTIPQFLKEYGIGWSYFNQFLDISPKLRNTFEVVVSKLHCKWIDLAFANENLPKHQHSILMKYIRAYDSHVWEMELKAKKEIENESLVKFIKFGSENYKDARLQGLYKRMYEQNANKRRDRKEA